MPYNFASDQLHYCSLQLSISELSYQFGKRCVLRLIRVLALCKKSHTKKNTTWRVPNLSADGEFEVTIFTKATLHFTGQIVWEPPVVYKSACIMDVEFFPFDIQRCSMKFGSWTYDGYELDLVHVCALDAESQEVIDYGIDLTDFYQNVEWDIISVTAQKHIKFYPCCIQSYPDLTFSITMRRKTLFHTVNLILPCVVISFLTILVFYLPSDSEEKITLCISILLSLTVFFLLLTEIIPPTSIVIPLIGKYLLFTMILVTLSILVTVFILTVHFRSPNTHTMSSWVRCVFLNMLPKMMCMRRPILRKHLLPSCCNGVKKQRNWEQVSSREPGQREATTVIMQPRADRSGHERPSMSGHDLCASCQARNNAKSDVKEIIGDVKFIADHLRGEDESRSIVEDWKFVAMVLDRLFFWIFTSASLIGTFGVLLQAPTIYDDRLALTAATSEDPC